MYAALVDPALNKISRNPHFVLCEGLSASRISQGHVDLWAFMIPVIGSARFFATVVSLLVSMEALFK